MQVDQEGTPITWLTKDQMEMKLSLGTKGVIHSWYDSAGLPVELYISTSRCFALDPLFANELLRTLLAQKPHLCVEKLNIPSNRYGVSDVHIWGFMYQDVLHCWRVVNRGEQVLQLWYLVEQTEAEYPSDPFQDPIVQYFVEPHQQDVTRRRI